MLAGRERPGSVEFNLEEGPVFGLFDSDSSIVAATSTACSHRVRARVGRARLEFDRCSVTLTGRERELLRCRAKRSPVERDRLRAIPRTDVLDLDIDRQRVAGTDRTVRARDCRFEDWIALLDCQCRGRLVVLAGDRNLVLANILRGGLEGERPGCRFASVKRELRLLEAKIAGIDCDRLRS